MTTARQLVRDPRLARLGVSVQVGDDAGGAKAPGAERTATRSPFVDVLPEFTVERAYFHNIAAPQGVTYAAGQQAWYGLRRLKVSTLGQEFTLKGAAICMLPTDSTGGALTGYTVPLAWGDTRGLTAAIVVGKNLPITQGAWAAAPAYLPGIEAGSVGQTAGTLIPPSGRVPVLAIVQGFPTGNYRDTVPNKPLFLRSFAPDVLRVAKGDTLDVALVVKGSILSALSGGETLVGYADVALTIGLTKSESNFSGG